MVKIFKKEAQAYGAFNGGEIIENKPIGFPREGGSLRPFSNLFYWAHAKAVKDSTIGLHPHQGFEICSFVLKGEIRHFDTKQEKWISLQAGDVQIIRAGNGISHSEFMKKDAEMFQIWFDPNLNETMKKPASYDDYKAADFPIEKQNSATITHLVGGGSPFKMDSSDVVVQKVDLNEGSYEIALPEHQIASIYAYDETINVNDNTLENSGFALVSDEKCIKIEANNNARVYIMLNPKTVDYSTYASMKN